MLPGWRGVRVNRVTQLIGAIGAEGNEVRIRRIRNLRAHGDVVIFAGRERVTPDGADTTLVDVLRVKFGEKVDLKKRHPQSRRLPCLRVNGRPIALSKGE